MNKTTIEWTDYTWNPVTGCDKVSAGCRSCYAETMAKRFWGDRKFTDVQMHDDRLNEPLEMGKKLHGKKVFVCDVSDLFHEDVPFDFITKVFGTMHGCPDTIFQLLTKRPDRALEFWKRCKGNLQVVDYHLKTFFNIQLHPTSITFPPPNIWLGVSCEDQKTADQRIPILLQIPAAVRFLSCEPLIGPIDFRDSIIHYCSEKSKTDENFRGDFYNGKITIDPTPSHRKYVGIDWVIAGGESGHHARPMHPAWAHSLRDQCKAANVPFFFKQWGAYIPSYQAGERISEIANYNKTFGERWITDAKAFSDGLQMVKVGKSKSGNLLDGVQHLQFPVNSRQSTVDSQ